MSETSHPSHAELPSRPFPLGEMDLHLFGEGAHERLYEKLGAHPARGDDGRPGVQFAVWAPNARGVSVAGDFNSWDPRAHPMNSLGSCGLWELFIPGVPSGSRYKYALRTVEGFLLWKADPFARRTEPSPGTASVVPAPLRADPPAISRTFQNGDVPHRRPLSIYELHLGSWRRIPEEGNRPLTYREIAGPLADYVQEMEFTHVELLPVMEHPFGGSWGYQVGSYFAPTARYGGPDDFRFLVETLRRRGIGVILDWVPAHFPQDPVGLGRFDGTALFEHLDPQEGVHPDWNTFIFNYGRNEVRNFLIANAFYWLSEFHVDGLRLDAVASMIYRNYSRPVGQWVPNRHGGVENLEAVSFLRELNERVHARFPGVLMIAEESTAWPGVSRPTWAGGLGFGFKWNLGWMHDTLSYFRLDPVHRRFHHHRLTFGLLYAWSENFILSLSHDEVVHGKGSLLGKMPGDRWRSFANLRALYGYMWAHPGKKLLFMGGEFAQEREWNHDASLDWHLAGRPEHAGVVALVRDLNRLYRRLPALWESDGDPSGFRWIVVDDAASNVIAFQRQAAAGGRSLISACNFSPVPRRNYRLGLPGPGVYDEILNTDSALYGGANIGNGGSVLAEPIPAHGHLFSAELTLPPLATVWFTPR